MVVLLDDSLSWRLKEIRGIAKLRLKSSVIPVILHEDAGFHSFLLGPSHNVLLKPHLEFRILLSQNRRAPALRSLDTELKQILKVKDAAFDPDKISFVLVARGEMQQAFTEKSQAHVGNALRQAEKSSWEAFVTQLDTDQANFRSCSGYFRIRKALGLPFGFSTYVLFFSASSLDQQISKP